MGAASPAVKLAIGEQIVRPSTPISRPEPHSSNHPPKPTVLLGSSDAIPGNTSVVEVFEGISDHSIDFDNSHTSVHSVKGRLKDHFNFWSHDLGASDFILQVISNGYAIPFVTIPPKAFFRNNNSAVKEAGFVSEALQELVHSGYVVEVSTPPHVVYPLSVSIQSTGKKRLILDLRHVNFHVWKEKFKFEDIRMARNYLPYDQFMFKFYLKSGYHHLDILQEHQTFLGISWVINGIRKYFVFIVVPFGLSSAPYIFSKVVRVLVIKLIFFRLFISQLLLF